MTNQDLSAPSATLRDAIRADLRPVRRLRAPAVRALWLAPLAFATLVSAVLVFSLRRDAAVLGVSLTWTASALQVAIGVWLIALALRDAVPGREIPARALVTAIAIVLGFSAGVTLQTWFSSPIDLRRSWAFITALCFAGTWITALPLLIVAVLLVARAYPTRPWSTGLLAGLGAGAAADAGWRLFCHFSQPIHVLVSHTAGMIAAGIAGAVLANALASHRQSRRGN